MTSLEKEFKKLMQEVIDKITERQQDGTYDKYDADELIQMCKNAQDNTDSSTYGRTCPYGHVDPDCGWSPSMGYHC